MKCVLDSNVALKWVLTEADSDKARSLRSEFQNQMYELLALDVFPVEVAHGLRHPRFSLLPLTVSG